MAFIFGLLNFIAAFWFNSFTLILLIFGSSILIATYGFNINYIFEQLDYKKVYFINLLIYTIPLIAIIFSQLISNIYVPTTSYAVNPLLLFNAIITIIISLFFYFLPEKIRLSKPSLILKDEQKNNILNRQKKSISFYIYTFHSFSLFAICFTYSVNIVGFIQNNILVVNSNKIIAISFFIFFGNNSCYRNI